MKSRVYTGRLTRSLLMQTRDGGSLDKARAGEHFNTHKNVFVESMGHGECLTNKCERQGMPR